MLFVIIGRLHHRAHWLDGDTHSACRNTWLCTGPEYHVTMATASPSVTHLVEKLLESKASASSIANAALNVFTDSEEVLTEQDAKKIVEGLLTVLKARSPSPQVLSEAVQTVTLGINSDGGKGKPFLAELLRNDGHLLLTDLAHSQLRNDSSKGKGRRSGQGSTYQDSLQQLRICREYALRNMCFKATAVQREVSTVCFCFQQMAKDASSNTGISRYSSWYCRSSPGPPCLP